MAEPVNTAPATPEAFPLEGLPLEAAFILTPPVAMYFAPLRGSKP